MILKLHHITAEQNYVKDKMNTLFTPNRYQAYSRMKAVSRDVVSTKRKGAHIKQTPQG